MQVTTGVDMIEVGRIKKAIEELGEAFLNKIYTKEEIAYCNGASSDMKYQHFAARFAAKEATFKAISGYIKGREDALWKEIEIINEAGGRPKINLEKLQKQGLKELKSIDVSLSHIKDYAVASVSALFEECQ